MAPEQITGRAGTASDIFAWAVSIGFAASGESPFGTGTSQGVMYRILHSVPDIEAIPESVRPQVAAALAKDPADRPAADELLAQLTGTAAPDRDHDRDTPTQTVLLRTWRPTLTTRHDGPAAKRSAAKRSAAKRPSGRVRVMRPVMLGLAVVIVAVAATLGFTMAGQPNAGGRNGGAAPRPSPARGQTARPAPAALASAATALPDLTAGSYSGVRPVCLRAGQVPTTVVLADPVGGRFTQLTESRAGSSVTYTYPGNWPVSAS